jgi:hypothetical protein
MPDLARVRSALQLHPVFWDNGQEVPLALFEPMAQRIHPAGSTVSSAFLTRFKGREWGGPATPVFHSSSNFGIVALYNLRTLGRMEQLPYASAHGAVEQLRAAMGWRGNISLFSRACVSAHIALAAATRSIEAGAEQALVVSFDFVSPFVAGGFQCFEDINGAMPQPYHRGVNGSIALGDGAAYALSARPAAASASNPRVSGTRCTTSPPTTRTGAALRRPSTRSSRVWADAAPASKDTGPAPSKPDVSRPAALPKPCPTPRLSAGRAPWATHWEAAASSRWRSPAAPLKAAASPHGG